MKTTDEHPGADLIAGRYRLDGLLGRGAMADVYGALDERTGALVAVKLIQPEDPNLTQRLAREATALQSLNHPGLVRFLDMGIYRRLAYLVMERVDGVTLAQVLSRGPMSTRDAAHLGAVLADTLSYVHSQRIVHRDVKPSNILLTANGGVKLADFGIARLLDASTVTLTGTTLGTAAYMAPEQLGDHHVGTSADIWSLGVVLLECLIGRRVFEGAPAEVVARRLAGPLALPGDLPVPWRVVLSGMLDPRPSGRLTGAEASAFLKSAAVAEPRVPSAGADASLIGMTAPFQIAAIDSGRGENRPIETMNTGVDMRSTPERRHKSAFWWSLAAIGGLAVAGALVALSLALLSTTSPHRRVPAAGASTKSTIATPPTTTSPSSTTTTTTASPSESALAVLLGDLSSATAAGSMSAATARSISIPAEEAVSAVTAGDSDQAANDIQQSAQAIVTAGQFGSITRAEEATLQSDLSTLAGSIGLGGAAAPPTTGTATTTGSAPGYGHHYDH